MKMLGKQKWRGGHGKNYGPWDGRIMRRRARARELAAWCREWR